MGAEILVIVVGVAVVLVVGFVALLALLALVFYLRRRGPSGPSREEMLRGLGYTPGSAANTWSRPFQGAALVFSEANGFQWTVRLPRYNTLTLHVEEREGGGKVEGRPFETEKPLLDRRFVMAAGQPGPQTVALVCMASVTRALAELKFVSLKLSGDELVLRDPERKNVEKGGDAIEAERQAHLAVIALLTALFDTMYSKLTGTIMPDFR